MAADVGETGPVVAAVVVPLTAVAAAAVGPSVAVVGVAVAVVASAADAGEAQEVMAVAEGEDLRTAEPRRPAVHTALNLAAVSVVRVEMMFHSSVLRKNNSPSLRVFEAFIPALVPLLFVIKSESVIFFNLFT